MEKSSSGFSELKRNGGKFVPPPNWADAPEFVPRFFAGPATATAQAQVTEQKIVIPVTAKEQFRSYADVAKASSRKEHGKKEYVSKELCPQATIRLCQHGEHCDMLHGLQCPICGWNCLHPTDIEERTRHEKECMKEFEENMEFSFAVAKSGNRTCGICMDSIVDKEKRSERRFGILTNCNHCFCLPCIRTWRSSKQYDDSKHVRSCPQCRVISYFVVPSDVWVDDKDNKEEKEELIAKYKTELSKKDCMYYKDEKKCPFGNKCFYKHALPNGMLVDVGPPRRLPRTVVGNDGPMLLQELSMFDFVLDHERTWGWELEFMDMDMEFPIWDSSESGQGGAEGEGEADAPSVCG